MNKYLIPLCFATLLCATSCNSRTREAQPPTTAQNEAGLQAAESRYDFGSVSKSKKDSVIFEFELRNKGKEPVVIDEIDLSCSCLSISSRPDTLQPGTSATIRGAAGIKESKGKFSKPIFVNYNNEEVLLLRIVGNVTD